MVLSTLILSILASIALGGDSCPVGSFASFDGKKCLQVVSLETTFQSAQGICASFGGNLASIHNKYDNALIEEHVNENFWLGGSDLSDNNAWKWTDGSKFDYAYWAAGGPSHNSGDDCLLVDKMTGLWQAKPCNTQAFFVCETVVNSCTPSNCPTPKPTTCPSCNCPSQTTPNSYPLGPCPSGAYCNGGYEYRLIGGPKTWSNARSYCKSLGGDMASIHNSDVGSEMYQMLEGNSYNAWLGGQVDANGVLRWIDGSPVDYQSWQQAYPVAYRQLTCALVALEGDVGGWENQNCLDKLSFVCEIPVFSS